MRKRIMSACLAFILIIISIDLDVLAMPIDSANENPAVWSAAASAEEETDTSNSKLASGDEAYANTVDDTRTESGEPKNASKDGKEGFDADSTGAEDDVNVSDVETDISGDKGASEDNAGEDADTEGSVPDDKDISEGSGTDTENNDSDAASDAAADTDEEADGNEDESETGLLAAEGPSYSMTQSFIIDTESPYDGDYLLVANVSTNAEGAAEASGELPVSDAALYNYSMENSENHIFVLDNPYVYDFDENGRGLIDPASFLPELVIDEGGIEYQADQETASMEYAVGDERNFRLKTTSQGYNSTDCICAAVGEYCTVWIPVNDPIYVDNADKMKGYMAEFAAEFDTQFPKMTKMFGSKETVDCLYGDNDGKTALICYDINGDGTSSGSYTAGYFFPADLNINYPNRTNNNIDCLHIDSWQGMYRDASSNTLNPLYGKRTMVHELQHMINYSICRNNEPSNKLTQLKVPTYLNEAYSEAAAHLCYGEATNRITNYNSYSYIDEGKVSLIDWDGSPHSISNYALSYFFSQYIRIHYENGDTIYKDAMNDLTMSNDLFTLIADKLGVSGEELLFNFRAALFLKNAEGVYGFGGEGWAESIKSKYAKTVTGAGLSLAPGAAVIVPVNDSVEPYGAGGNIRFAGMYSDLTEDHIEVYISGGDSISEDSGQLQLAASVSPKGVSQSVVFTLPYEEDGECAQVSTSGLVSAIANGTVTVRAVSVYNPSKYADMTITITGQRKQVIVRQARNLVLGGVKVACSVAEPAGAVLYYTTNGETPTTEDEVMPEEGVLFDAAGTYTLKVLGHTSDPLYKDGYMEDEIVIEQLPEPVISAEMLEIDGKNMKRVSIQAQEGAAVYYTTDSSIPSIENGTKYEEPFVIETLGATTVKAAAVKEGMADSAAASYEVWVQYAYETMPESARKPYLTQVSFILNKKSAEGTRFSILPIMDNEIVDAALVDDSGNFALERVQGTNDWKLGLANKTLANKTYQIDVRVISRDSDNVGYADTISIKLKVTDAKPDVSLKPVTINTVYPAAGYPLAVSSKSGKVEILGISDGNSAGFTENFELRDGALYLKKPYAEFARTPANKPVLSGRLSVRVEGYEAQELALNIKTTAKIPALTASVSSIRLNYSKLKEDGSFTFTLDKKINAKEKVVLEKIESVALNSNGGTNYKKAAELVEKISCEGGKNITVHCKDVKSGTYTLPLLVSAGEGEDAFGSVGCSVKFVIEKEGVNPTLKLGAAKVKLNRQTSGEKAYIAVKSAAQYNMELTDIQCAYAEMTKSVNKDQNVSLTYNADSKMLEAGITAEPSCSTYKFVCTPSYNGIAAQGGGINVTVAVIDKAPAVSLKAKGAIDVLNRDAAAVTYTVKKSNFADRIVSVEFEEALKLTPSILDAREFFNEPVLNGDSAVSISAKEDAVFTKGMKYAFRLKFMLEGSRKAVVTKDIAIKPKQSSVKLVPTGKPVFYTYVNTGNNTHAVTLQSSTGKIEKVEWNTDANKKVPEGITPVIEDGQLKAVAFDGNGNIKKGKYKLAFNVYYEGQLWERATSRKASYAKPTAVRLTVTVK